MATKLLAIMFGYTALFLCGLWSMQWGWGLELHSLAGVVFPSLLGTVIHLVCVTIVKLDDK